MGLRRLGPALVLCAGLLCMFTIGAPAGLADTIGGADYTVTLTQNGANVDVVVTANPGFSLKTGDGSDLSFNFTVSAAQITNLAADSGTYTGLTFNFANNVNIGG